MTQQTEREEDGRDPAVSAEVISSGRRDKEMLILSKELKNSSKQSLVVPAHNFSLFRHTTEDSASKQSAQVTEKGGGRIQDYDGSLDKITPTMITFAD